MMFFSSEEHAKEWAEKHPELDSDIISIDQGLAMTKALYENILDYDYEAPLHLLEDLSPLGLDRDFWKME